MVERFVKISNGRICRAGTPGADNLSIHLGVSLRIELKKLL